MKLRNRNPGNAKIAVDMSAMIDVVFQLLIFFMLTLKIVEPEGDFDINMPLGQLQPKPEY
ncbi:MAG: biopolymer transporter ExbD [Planctomycetaceae bacterium]